MTDAKQKHLNRIKGQFGSTVEFYKWVGYNIPHPNAYSYERTDHIDYAFEKLLDFCELANTVKSMFFRK